MASLLVITIVAVSATFGFLLGLAVARRTAHSTLLHRRREWLEIIRYDDDDEEEDLRLRSALDALTRPL